MSLQSSALPAEMRACLTLAGDHVECRCGHRFASEAGFTEVRDHARECFGKRQVRHMHEVTDRPRESSEDIRAMRRLQEMAAAQEIHMWRQRIVACCFNAGNERWGLV